MTDESPSPREILLVDDDAAVRKGYRLLFEQEGYAVRTARDGETAVRLFNERRPDLVLLDVMMPRMNGLVACREIRRIDETVPVLFFTAMPSEIALLRAFGCGGDDYIEKSRPPVEFLARLAGAMRRSAAASRVSHETVRIGAVTVDLSTAVVYDRETATDTLTRSDILLLRCLAARRGMCVPVKDLLAALYGEAFRGDLTQVRKRVNDLRGRLGRAGETICCVRGVGYRLL